MIKLETSVGVGSDDATIKINFDSAGAGDILNSMG